MKAWRGIIGLLLAAVVASAAQAQGYTPAPGTQAGSAAAGSPLDAIKGWLGGSTGQSDLLEPDRAFQCARRTRTRWSQR